MSVGLSLGNTDQLVVGDSLGTPVTAKGTCRRITVGEDPIEVGANWPTTAYYVYKPDYNATPRGCVIGSTYTFQSEAGYLRGQIAGYIKTQTGSTTFFQDESDE